jgi:hypothetical protein
MWIRIRISNSDLMSLHPVSGEKNFCHRFFFLNGIHPKFCIFELGTCLQMFFTNLQRIKVFITIILSLFSYNYGLGI